MTLTLSILRCPDAVPPETKRVHGGELRIGRGPDNDWIMPDPERMLSKRHCVIAFRNGGWSVADLSTNGTFLNRDADPIGSGQARDLRDGDRIRLGAYEIEARITEALDHGPRAGGLAAGPATGGFGGGSFDNPFGDNIFAPKPSPSNAFTTAAFGASDPLFGGAAPAAQVRLPDDFDPLGGSDSDMFGPTQPDHTPSFSDAFRPPAARQILPAEDEWDLSLPEAAPPPAAFPMQPAPPPAQPASYFGQPEPSPAQSSPFQSPPAPLPVQPLPMPAQPASFPQQSPFSPPGSLAEPARQQAPGNPFADPADFHPAPLAIPPPAPPAIPPIAQPAAPPPAFAAPQAAPPPPAPAAETLLAAFLAGAGIAGAQPADPPAMMRALGATFRALVSGIRQAMIARSSIKSEFRIEQTMIRARGNNPLKFSADDDDALTALLGLGRRVDMAPDAAVADALRDIRLHELATIAAMQQAMRSLLGQLAPASLEVEGGMTLVPAQKKARAYEAYEKLYEKITRALTDDFDSVFGKSFARAYENALREISSRDRQ